MGDGLKVIWVDASAVATQVIEFEPVRDRPVLRLPSHRIGEPLSLGRWVEDASISVLVEVPRPNEARTLTAGLCVYPLLQ